MAHAQAQEPRILVLIPVYNEGMRVAEVVRVALEHLPVLVVDDGSSDDSAAYAEHAGAIVLRQRPNQGKGEALRAGFRWALELNYDAVITLDADGQHDPAEIPAFLHAYRELGGDLVIGERSFTQMPFPRNLSNTFGRWLFSWAVGQHVSDNQSGYRLLSRRMMEATLASRERGFEFEVEMIVTCIRRGYRLVGVPIRTIYGDETSHIKPVAQTVHFFRVVGQTRRAMQGHHSALRPHRAPYALIALVLVLLAVLVALLLSGNGGDGDGDNPPDAADQLQGVTAYPTPAPVTFIPPTLVPDTPAPTTPPPEMLGQEVPDFTLSTLDGGTIALPALRGEITLLNFWATWCTPCREEMPLLQQVAAQGRAQVVAVTDPNEGQTLEQITEFVDRYGIEFPVALSSEDALYQTFAVEQIPMTFIIDRDGVIRFVHLGELHEHDITDYLAQLED